MANLRPTMRDILVTLAVATAPISAELSLKAVSDAQRHGMFSHTRMQICALTVNVGHVVDEK